jgi:hypothetical protein
MFFERKAVHSCCCRHTHRIATIVCNTETILVQVVRAAESCAATMAGVLPPDMVVRVLNPIVKTGDFPVNQVPMGLPLESRFLQDLPVNEYLRLFIRQDYRTGITSVSQVPQCLSCTSTVWL